MTTTMNMNSLEKLIQMATIEQMYSMLQKMKSNTETVDTTNFHDESQKLLLNRVGNLEQYIFEIDKKYNDTDILYSDMVRNQDQLVKQLMSQMDTLTQRIEQMEKEFVLERCDPPMSNPPMSNPPMSNPPMSNVVEPDTCENIVLTVEEPYISSESTIATPFVPDLSIIENKETNEVLYENKLVLAERELHEDEYMVLLDNANQVHINKDEEDIDEVESDELLSEEVQVKKEDICGEMESDVLPAEEVQVTTEVNEEPAVEELATEEVEDSEPEVETEEEEVEEEEDTDEEVFEIEIDDVTYYATSEDNGILYEMLEGGDIGKQVGTIQDGEPIFT